MNENENKINEINPDENKTPDTDYIEVISKLKSSSVSKEQYEKVLKENKRLLDNIVNGKIDEQGKQEETVDLKELRKKMFSGNLNNLEYAKTILAIREETIKSGKPDPFLPIGRNVAPDDNSVKDAQNVAELLQDCVEYADNDSNIFTDALQRRMVDLPRPRRH